MFLDSNYQVELQHQATPKGMIVGGALDAGPGGHLLGIAAFVGSQRRWGGWFFEGTVGVGVEVNRVYVPSQGSPFAYTAEIQPALYARAVGAIGHPISKSLDILGRLSLHLEPNDPYGSNLATNDFASATIGLRLRLP